MKRRDFLANAAALGVAAIWARPARAGASRASWREDRTVYPQGVASGDPDDHSVILWTRRPFADGERHGLVLEVASDRSFDRVVASVQAPVMAAADWTCRVLVGGLAPATVYWYRFTDASGRGSRIGRTMTAPRATDPRPVRFAFVSCQSVNEGAQNAYRRMIWEDARADADAKLGFVRQVSGAAPEATVNLTIKHGVRSALEYAANGNIATARAATNPDVAPHLEFVDMGGHGYAVVTAGPDAIDTEFVCVARPIVRATTEDGGPLRYRVSHRAPMWKVGEAPKLEQRMLEGSAELSV